MGVGWIIVCFAVYIIIGCIVVEKVVCPYDDADLLDSIICGLMGAFWPITLCVDWLLKS